MTFNNQPAPADAARQQAADARGTTLLQHVSRSERSRHTPLATRRTRSSSIAAILRDESGAASSSMQDEASQLVALLAGRRQERCVLDTCASPGGKATAIAAALGAGERLIACDVRDRRMALLRRDTLPQPARRNVSARPG